MRRLYSVLTGLIVLISILSCNSNPRIGIVINISDDIIIDSLQISTLSDNILLKSKDKIPDTLYIGYVTYEKDKKDGVIHVIAYLKDTVISHGYGYYSNNLPPFKLSEIMIENDTVYSRVIE